MPYRVSKKYSNTQTGLDELAEDIRALETGEFTRIVYGSITAKRDDITGQVATYDEEELLNEICTYLRTNFRADIKYSGDSQKLGVHARIGPVKTVSFNTALEHFDHGEDFSQFLSQNEGWKKL